MLVAEGITGAEALKLDLAFLEYWVNDINYIYISSFCSHQSSSTNLSLPRP